jgi:hypothetical protein
MQRTTAGLCVAAVLGLGVAVGAQSSATAPTPGQRSTASQRAASDKEHEVNVTGCVARAADGKFTLTNARVEPMSSASTTTGSSSTATTTGTTGTTGATTTATEPSGSGTRPEAGTMTFLLSGGSDLDKHVGHRVQVTGRTSSDWSKEQSSPTS